MFLATRFLILLRLKKYLRRVTSVHVLICRLFIADLAGPDMIYLLEFFRVQLSVSVLLGLVFVPKVCVPLQN